jgi:hypothetical protein
MTIAPMSKDATTAYFDDMVKRAAKASIVERDILVESESAKCHQNCEAFAARFEGHAVVRGWLVIGEHLCIPDSVVRNVANDALTAHSIDRRPCANVLSQSQPYLYRASGSRGGLSSDAR